MLKEEHQNQQDIELGSIFSALTAEVIPPPSLYATYRSQLSSIFEKLHLHITEQCQEAIDNYLLLNSYKDLGSIVFGLYEQQLIKRSTLINLFTLQHDLCLHPQIRGWWEQEKNILRWRYGKSDNNNHKAIKNPQTLVASFLQNSRNEKFLVETFKSRLTEYARKNFYTYKSGNSYFYSIRPDEESLGGRCDENGKPLKDEFGNELTDSLGNFRYAITKIQSRSDGSFVEKKKIVQQGTSGATPLTDKNGKPLSVTYREIIQQEKPKNTKKTRADAVNYLFQLIDNSSADAINRYLLLPAIQDLNGTHEFHLTLWKTHLFDICQEFIRGYQQLIHDFDEESLLTILMDVITYRSLTNEQLAQLFWQYNPKLVADVIVTLYQEIDFHCDDLNYSVLQSLLNNEPTTIETINARRCKLKSKLLLPLDTRSPGKNIFEEENLTKQQLFQYEEQTIAAIEHLYRTSFTSLIINSLYINRLAKYDHLRSDTFAYFYLIPSNAYMLLDPNKTDNVNYYRYLQLKKDLNHLVHDPNLFLFEKPVIFFGILNIDGNHYIPYFIYRNKKNKVFVITVDPSPQMYPLSNQDKEHYDAKSETHKKLIIIFEDLLPGCVFYDPGVTQMLRERDCGPNSAQTLLDALESATTCHSLLWIDDNDALVMRHERLTLKGEPVGIDPYIETFIYPAEIETNSNLNRKLWQEHLMQLNEVSQYVRLSDQKHSLSLMDTYDLYQTEYCYLRLVNGQSLNDERNTNLSAIQTLLLSDEKGKSIIHSIIANYKKTLQLSQFDQLAAFIKSKIDSIQLDQYTSAHHKNLQLLMEDLETVILKEYIPEALETSLQLQVLNCLPKRTDLSASKIVADFLGKHKVVFKRLSPNEQMTITNKLIESAEQAVRKKLTDLYLEIVTNVIMRNCFNYLTQGQCIDSPETINDLIDILMSQLRFDNSVFFTDYDNKYTLEQVRAAICYLKLHTSDELNKIIQSEVHRVANEAFSEAMSQTKNILNLEECNVHNLLCYFSAIDSSFLPPHPSLYLPKTIKHYLISQNEINSPLGKWIVSQLNLKLYDEIAQILPAKVKSAVEYLVRFTSFAHEIAKQPIDIIDRSLNLDNTLSCVINYAPYIGKYGYINSITQNDYLHPLGYYYIQQELQYHTAAIFLKKRQSFFSEMAGSILNENSDILNVESLIQLVEKNTDIISLLLHQARTKSSLIEQKYVGTFLESPHELALNMTGVRFREFFAGHLEMVYANLKQAIELKQTITETLALFRKLESKKCISVCDILARYLKNLEKMLAKFMSLSVFQDFESNYQLCHQQFFLTLKDMVAELFNDSGYLAGDVQPGTVAVLVRPFFCSLFGLDSLPVLSPAEASKIDHQINQTLYKLPMPLSIIDSKLIILDVVSEIPKAYNSKLTLKLLLELISFWFSNRPYLPFIQLSIPSLITLLIKVANKNYLNEYVDPADVQLLRDALPKSTENQLQLFSNTDAASMIAAVLLNTVDIAGATFQDTAFTFADISSLLQGKMPSSSSSTSQTAEDSTELELLSDNNNVNLSYLSLQRTGLRKLSIFDTELDKDLIKLKARHEKGDQLDSWDIDYLADQLRKRWQKLLYKEGEKAARNHYLTSRFGYDDSECIVIAQVISKYHRSQGKTVFIHDLLMPDFFPKVTVQPSNEDIPLAYLVITRSGYPLNIDLIIKSYSKAARLINPYHNQEFSLEEMEDILKHPRSSELVEQVKRNHTRRISLRGVEFNNIYFHQETVKPDLEEYILERELISSIPRK